MKNKLIIVLLVLGSIGCSRTIYVPEKKITPAKVCELIGSNAQLVVNDENYTCQVTINNTIYVYEIVTEEEDDNTGSGKDKDKKDKDND